ncbi:hypothetical protein L218DRAFT_948697 [Marasmius fiardii PR-910]|nr:hypothetical protein L218DRAFT_948697 [Marasmius fiardii PR-910]
MTPHLTHLDLGSIRKTGGCTLISTSIGKLTTDGAQNIILPDLQHIGLSLSRLDDDLMTRILALAASRTFSRLSQVNGVRPLKEIHVHYINPEFCLKPHMLEEIKRLEKDGLEVMVLRDYNSADNVDHRFIFVKRRSDSSSHYSFWFNGLRFTEPVERVVILCWVPPVGDSEICCLKTDGEIQDCEFPQVRVIQTPDF